VSKNTEDWAGSVGFAQIGVDKVHGTQAAHI